MHYRRMPIEVESPEELGYSSIRYNLAESSVRDIDLRHVKISNKTLLCYGSHRGKDELRYLISLDYSPGKIDDILITPGAAAALFIIHTCLLEKNDEIIVLHPNYATNLETPFALGCKINKVELKFSEQFNLKAADVIDKITRKTKLVSLTNPHNPTGKVFERAELEKVISFCSKRKIHVLVDETYCHIPLMGYNHKHLTQASNLIRVSSLSKAFGVPGIRMGWIQCSGQSLMKKFLAAKEQIVICNSVVDEEIAFEIMKKREQILKKVRKDISRNYKVLSGWLGTQKVLDYVSPEGGVVMMPRLKNSVDTRKFYQSLLNEYSTYVGPGHWFGMSDRFFRLGYGWAHGQELKKGLAAIEKASSPF